MGKAGSAHFLDADVRLFSVHLIYRCYELDEE